MKKLFLFIILVTAFVVILLVSGTIQTRTKIIDRGPIKYESTKVEVHWENLPKFFKKLVRHR